MNYGGAQRSGAGVGRARQRMLDHYYERQTKLAAVKLEAGCADCPPGTEWPSVCLDFDHVRGEKLFGLSTGGWYAWSKVEAEIAKCEVVCSNHHRIRTQERGQCRISA